MSQCIRCSKPVEPKRVQYGYATCLNCGDKLASKVRHTVVPIHSKVRHTVVPIHKSNYVVASSLSMLKQLNPKRSGDDYE